MFSGMSPDDKLVEFVELPRDVHPYYVATQAHPELRSRPTRPHPLFAGLVGAAIDRQRELRFPIDETGLRRPPADERRRADAGDGRWRTCGDEPDAVARRPSQRTCTAATGCWRCAPTLSARPGRPDEDVRAAASSSTPARSWSWPSTTTSGCVVLRQYRHPVARPGWSSCRPGCSTSRGRTRSVAARRELVEEAALVADQLDGTW